MTRIDLSELDRTGVRCRLSGDQAAALDASGLVEPRPLGGDEWRLVPAGRVGAVQVGGLDVQVHPKTGIARLLFLLGYARDPGFRAEDVTATAEPDLWPALAESLARQAERALAPGVLQGYVTVEEALPLVRGRIRFADQWARRSVQPLPIEVTYDDYAVDTAENRILRAALRRLAVVPRLPNRVRVRLMHLDGRLDGVRLLPAGAVVPPWRPSRLNARYLPALRLAELVLRHHSAEPGSGGQGMAAFVVNMATVFEDFVTTALREALRGRPGRTESQYRIYLDEEMAIPIRPDVVHVEAGSPVAVFDAKYKLEGPAADAYQMLAYCTALSLPAGWLIYARGTPGALHRRVRKSGIDIIQYGLDLDADPVDLLRQVAALAYHAFSLEVAVSGLPALRGAEAAQGQ